MWTNGLSFMMSFQWESVQEYVFSVLADGLNSYCSANNAQFRECCRHDPYRYLKIFLIIFRSKFQLKCVIGKVIQKIIISWYKN